MHLLVSLLTNFPYHLQESLYFGYGNTQLFVDGVIYQLVALVLLFAFIAPPFLSDLLKRNFFKSSMGDFYYMPLPLLRDVADNRIYAGLTSRRPHLLSYLSIFVCRVQQRRSRLCSVPQAHSPCFQYFPDQRVHVCHGLAVGCSNSGFNCSILLTCMSLTLYVY